MSRRDDLVLAALGAAAEREGNLHWARVFLGRADPLLRPGLLRRVERAIEEARDLTGGGAWGDEGPAHLARLAYLLAAGVDVGQAEVGALAAIRERYDQARAGHPGEVRPRWSLTLGLVATLVLAALGAGAYVLWTHERTPSLDGARRTPPPPAGAYARGGVPARSSARLDKVFGEQLTAFQVGAADLGRARAFSAPPRTISRLGSRLRARREALLSPANRRALGVHPARRLADLAEALKLASISAGGKPGDRVSRAFSAAVAQLDRELAAGDFAYHVVGDELPGRRGRLFLLATYRVARVVRRAVVGRPVTVLHLDRLDRSNWKPDRLGAERAQDFAPFVEMSVVRRNLLTFTIPDLVTQGGLVYQGERLSNQMVRKDYQAVLEDRVADLIALGALLAKRRRVLRRIQRHPRTKLQFLFPDTMRRDRELLALFRKDFNAPVALANAYETVLGDIDVPAYRGLVDKLARLHAGPVERFVLQLWFDRHAKVPAMPPAVAAHLRGLLAGSAHNRRVARVARDQLSGQLAQLAGSAPITRTVLTQLAGNVFDPDGWDTPRCFATMILLKELAKELGVVKGATLDPGKRPDREVASHVYAALVRMAPARLRAGARAVWARLFGRAMPGVR